jgi:hypothetical protein
VQKSIANWGNYPALKSNEFQFTTVSELKKIVKDNPTLIARGNGRCYGDASLQMLLFLP